MVYSVDEVSFILNVCFIAHMKILQNGQNILYVYFIAHPSPSVVCVRLFQQRSRIVGGRSSCVYPSAPSLADDLKRRK